MALAFYMDENLAGPITVGLRRLGVDVLTAEADGHRETDDDRIIDRATALDRVAVSQDQDFLRIAHERQASGRPFSGVIYAAQGGMTFGRYIRQLDDYAKAGDSGDLWNEVVYMK